MVGLGGGAFYVPLLLALGYEFQGASTLSLFLIMVTGFAAFLQFRKARLVDWQLALVMEIFTDIGAFAGGFTSRNFSDVYLRAPLKIVFFRDCGVSVVLESSCIPLYTAVLRAPLPCTHEKIRIFRDALNNNIRHYFAHCFLFYYSDAAERRKCR